MDNKFELDQNEIKKRLTEMEYKVTQEAYTERPYTGKYNNFFEQGIYNCIVCLTPLFKSVDKFNSGCGWPAFSEESYKDTIDYLSDVTHGMKRVEIKCKKCGAHLGHVFHDGPKPTGKRYCVNSASLNFNKE